MAHVTNSGSGAHGCWSGRCSRILEEMRVHGRAVERQHLVWLLLMGVGTKVPMTRSLFSIESTGRVLKERVVMTARSDSRLAAAIFAVVALLQLLRALAGWPITVGDTTMPVWPSWVACVVAAGLAWLGFTRPGSDRSTGRCHGRRQRCVPLIG